LGNKNFHPSLTARFNLAAKLANTVLYLHSAGWLHKNLRSENIVFFLPDSDLPTLSSPYVMGYQLARIDCNNELTEEAPHHWEADMYRHPETLSRARRSRFGGRFDVYSLGMVLLELAYWYPLTKIFDKVINPKNCNLSQIQGLQDTVLSEGAGYLAQVRFRMGDTYCEVVKACISGSFSSQDPTESDLDDREELAAFFHSIVQKLETCKA
jgi:serine/threonine protein kinase